VKKRGLLSLLGLASSEKQIPKLLNTLKVEVDKNKLWSKPLCFSSAWHEQPEMHLFILGELMLRVLVGLLCSVGIMTATSFTTSASCIVGGAGYPRNILDNGLTDCRAELDLPGINPIYSTATVRTSFDELSNGVQFSAHTAVTNVYNNPALYPNSQSTAVANVQFTLATAGPARSGYVSISGENSCLNQVTPGLRRQC
jgi:hypothetical protein